MQKKLKELRGKEGREKVAQRAVAYLPEPLSIDSTIRSTESLPTPYDTPGQERCSTAVQTFVKCRPLWAMRHSRLRTST